jgi:hypothetical protein
LIAAPTALSLLARLADVADMAPRLASFGLRVYDGVLLTLCQESLIVVPEKKGSSRERSAFVLPKLAPNTSLASRKGSRLLGRNCWLAAATDFDAFFASSPRSRD